MSSSKEYLAFVLDRLSSLNNVSYRGMMGEYVIYYKKKVIGGIYDNRFLIKPVKTAIELMPNASFELPYKGAKEMLCPDIDNKELLTKVIALMYEELPEPKIKNRKKPKRI